MAYKLSKNIMKKIYDILPVFELNEKNTSWFFRNGYLLPLANHWYKFNSYKFIGKDLFVTDDKKLNLKGLS